MFNDRLRFELEAKDEGLKSGFDAAQEAANSLDQTILRLQGSTLKYNSAVGRFTEESGKFVTSQKGLNSIGVQTTAQITRQIAAYDRLIQRFAKDKLVTQQLIEQKQRLQQSLTRTSGALGGTTTFAFQAGQAISDFAVAGVLGAANNVEFLTQQFIHMKKQAGSSVAVLKALAGSLTGPTGILLGVSAVSTAFIVFGDTISEFVTGSSKELDELRKSVKGVADELIRVKDGISVAFEGTVDELEADAVRVGNIIERLEVQRTALLSSLGREQFQQVGGVTTFVSDSQEIRRLEAQIETINKVLERQKGIQESINDTVDEQRLLEQVISDINGTQLERVEKKDKAKKEELSDLEKAIEKNRELTGLLDRLNSGEEDKRISIERQNRALSEQVKIAEALRSLQQQGADTAPRQVSGLGFDGSEESLDELLERLSKRDRKRNRNRLRPRQQSAADIDFGESKDKQVEALSDIVSGVDRTAEAFERAGITAQSFYANTREGQLSLFDTIQATTGGISDLFAAAYEASEEENKRYFAAYKAFAIAQATISTYVAANEALKAGPIVGPILAAATIAQGLANVIRIKSASPGGGGSGGGSTGGGRGTRTSGTATTAAPVVRDRGTFIPGAAPGGLKLELVESEYVDPAGNLIRRIRLAQANEVRAGRSGKLEAAK